MAFGTAVAATIPSRHHSLRPSSRAIIRLAQKNGAKSARTVRERNGPSIPS